MAAIDPYFAGVPSIQPAARKTCLAFHAKDDLPEVRREVYEVIARHAVRFSAVVRDKQAVLAYVHQRNERDAAYRYSPNELYDYLVRRLFRDRLHKDEGYRILFARRGASDRTAALQAALEAARRNFGQKHGILGQGPIEVKAVAARRSGGLQVADYFLWALQRLYERREERYLKYVWSAVSLVHDCDDTREKSYGVYYTRNNPLDLAALRKRLSGI